MMNLKFVISIKTLVPDNIITQEITVIKFDFIEKSFINVHLQVFFHLNSLPSLDTQIHQRKKTKKMAQKKI